MLTGGKVWAPQRRGLSAREPEQCGWGTIPAHHRTMPSRRGALALSLGASLLFGLTACKGEIRFGANRGDTGSSTGDLDGASPDVGELPGPDGSADAGPPPPEDAGPADSGCELVSATEWPWPRTKTEYVTRFYSFALTTSPKCMSGNCHADTDNNGAPRPYIPALETDLDSPANLDKAINQLFASMMLVDRNGQLVSPLVYEHRPADRMGGGEVPVYDPGEELIVEALVASIQSCAEPPDAGVPEDSGVEDAGPEDGAVLDAEPPDGAPLDAATSDVN